MTNIDVEGLDTRQSPDSLELGEVSQPLKRDIDSRAADNFFVDWLLHSRDQATIRGFWDDLPMLYHNTPPSSPLSLSIKAAAFAGIKNAVSGGVPFHIKARQCYGEALRRMTAVVGNQQRIFEDQALAALLLIDMFEVSWEASTISSHINTDHLQLVHVLGKI